MPGLLQVWKRVDESEGHFLGESNPDDTGFELVASWIERQTGVPLLKPSPVVVCHSSQSQNHFSFR